MPRTRDSDQVSYTGDRPLGLRQLVDFWHIRQKACDTLGDGIYDVLILLETSKYRNSMWCDFPESQNLDTISFPDSQETSILVCHAVRHSVRHFVTFVRHSHFEVSDFSLFIFRKVVNALSREDPPYLRFIVEPHPHFDEFPCVTSHFDKVAAAHFREN